MHENKLLNEHYSYASMSWPGTLSRLLGFKGADNLSEICFLNVLDLSEFPLPA